MTFTIAPLPNPAFDLDAVSRVTYSAVFSDICDRLGLRSQTAAPGLLPLAGSGTLIGWARTAVSLPVTIAPERPYGHEIDFIDSLRLDDVVVLDCSQAPVAAWGELFSTAAKGRGARGVIVDGYLRDRSKIEALGFLAFGRGCRPTDSLGRISLSEADITVEIGGVPVRSGDLVIADEDGMVAVPREQAAEAIRLAVEKASTENKARDLLLQGGFLAQVWERFRVL
jgi:4-hydroxy-4-methyl-2-oxoglutarate aldolase